MTDQNRDMRHQGNVTKVTIYGTEYPITGDTDGDYIREVAAFVDAKMREVDRTTSAKSSLKVAILTALNIADELFRERADKDDMIQHLEEKVRKLSSLIKLDGKPK